MNARGDARKFLLCTNTLAQEVDAFTDGTGISGYCISNSAPDNAPLKSVQIVLLSCPDAETPKVIGQLLPEVSV